MLKTLAPLRSLTILVPFSGIQFLDFGFNVERVPRSVRSFHEMSTPEGLTLFSVETDPQTGDALHPATGTRLDEQSTYTCGFRDSLGMFLDKWVPLPVFRLLGLSKEGAEVFDEGPSNWARLYVTALPEPDPHGNTHRVVVAFDTNLVPRPRTSEAAYVAPTVQDAETEQQFALAHSSSDLYFFLGESWLNEWLAAMLVEYQAARGRQARGPIDPAAPKLEHAARYWTFLDIIAAAINLPRIRLCDTVSVERSYVPIQVNLVLDIGNSRTCGILIESDPDDNDRLNLSKSYVLELRDLTRPTHSYSQAFESRIEFARASFGRDAIARRSGRSNSFYWPSVVRVGPEAERLHSASKGFEGATGLSSPKRYLWDRRPLNQIWRFNGMNTEGALEPPVSGPIMAFVSEEGEVLRQSKRPATSAVRPKFSRSSMFTMMLTEIVLQALVTINSPQTRSRQRHGEVPRELRRITLTIPPGMPLAEQRILRQRATGAIKLAWDALGWLDTELRLPPEPELQIHWDEATCTQLVYLYTELTRKFPSAPLDMIETLGKRRPQGLNNADPTLRIASIDIGGGTTDLMITGYAVEDRRAIVPHQFFRESFKVAGDDILEAVVGLQVLPSIERHMKTCGAGSAKELIRGFVSSDRGNQSVQEQQLRRQFVTELAVPVALALMRACEQTPTISEQSAYTREFGSFRTPSELRGQEAAAHLEAIAAEAGAKDFKLDDVPVLVNVDAIAATVAATIADFLAHLCEVIHAYDCDVLLLSGRPSRLAIIRDLVLANMPVRPDRLLPMHQYRAGDWYPFRDAYGRIDDPKTTVVVGAMLANLAETQIEGFTVLTSRLNIRSTARFIGEMEGDQIPNRNLLFSDVDLDRQSGKDPAGQLRFYSPITIGFRQLDLARWPATPLYYLDFRDDEGARSKRRPLTAILERATPDAEDESSKEDFKITELTDAEGSPMRPSELNLRLQTTMSADGYWLDTGAISTQS
jgi:hypothetical protein